MPTLIIYPPDKLEVISSGGTRDNISSKQAEDQADTNLEQTPRQSPVQGIYRADRDSIGSIQTRDQANTKTNLEHIRTNEEPAIPDMASADRYFNLPWLNMPGPGSDPAEKLKYHKEHNEPGMVSAEMLAAAIQRGCSYEVLSNYIKGNNKEDVKEALNQSVGDGCHILYYAVRRNDTQILHLLLEYGADPNARGIIYDVPVHAWAIMSPKWTTVNSTSVVKMLLEYGADPEAIPRDFWFNYIAEPSASLKAKENVEYTRWCSAAFSALLVETMHITHRYSFFVASLTGRRYARHSQIVHGHGMEKLLKIHYRIIGQGPASKIVRDQISIFGELMQTGYPPQVDSMGALPDKTQNVLIGEVVVTPYVDMVVRFSDISNS